MNILNTVNRRRHYCVDGVASYKISWIEITNHLVCYVTQHGGLPSVRMSTYILTVTVIARWQHEYKR